MIKKLKTSNFEKGFTLMELTIVIAIIVILLSIMILNMQPVSDKTAALQAKSDAQNAYDAAQTYRLSTSKVIEAELKDILAKSLDTYTYVATNNESSSAKSYHIEPVLAGAGGAVVYYKVIIMSRLDGKDEIDSARVTIVSEFNVKKGEDLEVKCRGASNRCNSLKTSGVVK